MAPGKCYTHNKTGAPVRLEIDHFSFYSMRTASAYEMLWAITYGSRYDLLSLTPDLLQKALWTGCGERRFLELAIPGKQFPSCL